MTHEERLDKKNTEEVKPKPSTNKPMTPEWKSNWNRTGSWGSGCTVNGMKF